MLTTYHGKSSLIFVAATESEFLTQIKMGRMLK